jgi:uncharacterized protein involved in cysteine biosynthesis
MALIRDASGRPGLLRRAAAGAWHVPAGFIFLLRNPPLWPLAALPAFLTVVLIAAGFITSWYFASSVEGALAPSSDKIGETLSLAAWLALAVVTVVAGSLLGFALGLVLAAPVLDQLSRRTERRILGQTTDAALGLRWEVTQSLRGAFYFAAAVPLAFLIGLIPFVGPPLATAWAGYALAFQILDGPLSRHGLDFTGKRRWHRHWRAETMGFGLLSLLSLLVPFANLLVAPSLIVGATRLVIELGTEAGKGPEVRAQESASGLV